MSLRLIIEDYEGETTIVPLNEGKAPVTVGREDNNTIQLTEQNVSRNHARLNFGQTAWSLEDLESYNGVRVNGIMIDEPIPLQEGDVIQIGDYRLLLSTAERARADANALTAANATQTRAGGSGRLPTLTSTELHSMISDTVTSGRSRGEDDIQTFDGSRQAVTQRNPAINPADYPASVPGDGRAPQVVAENVGARPKPGSTKASGASNNILIVVGAIVLLAAAAAAYQFLGVKDPAPDSETTVQQASGQRTTAARSESAVLRTVPEAEPNVGDPQDSAAGQVGQLSEDNMEDAQPSAAVPEADEPERPRPRKTKIRRPSVAREQLQRAREASLAGDQSRAYRLAKDSYSNDPTPASLQLMGLAACKMGRRSGARSAYKRMRKAEHRRLLHQVCASNGIDLG